MAEIRKNFQNAVARILEVVMFENWLRFYFIREEKPAKPGDEPELSIAVPEKSMAKIKDFYPDLWPLAEQMNNRPVSFETSRQAVLMHVLENVDGKIIPGGIARTVISSEHFQNELQLFNFWEQTQEERLDQHFIDFGGWRDLFQEWRNGTGAKEFLAKIRADAPGDS